MTLPQHQTDLEETVPTQEYLIMHGQDAELEAEISEIWRVVKPAIQKTMRAGKVVRLKKGRPVSAWKSQTVRQHLSHGHAHRISALGNDDPFCTDHETSLPHLYHLITRAGMSLVREKEDEEREAARLGEIEETKDE